ncbi:MAG: hypothetical protein AAF662_05090 [Pseudomonadota bacterium]
MEAISTSMTITADHLRRQVIVPTLQYLGEWSPDAECALLKVALSSRTASGADSAGEQIEGLGLFGVTSNEHRDVWDRYLAFRPEIAAKVRGLASQRSFLSNPDNELQTNLGYSAAIAWVLRQRQLDRGASDLKGSGWSTQAVAQA